MKSSRMTRSVGHAICGLLLIAGTAAAQGTGSMGGSAMPKQDAMGMAKMPEDDATHAPGMFQGAGGRTVSGHLMMVMKDGHPMIQLGQDFKVDRNNNIDVVLSSDMMYSASSSLMVGKLGKASGKQAFMVPSGTMIDHYHYALLRDRSSGEVVGAAKLPAAGMMAKDGMGRNDGMMKHDSGMMKKPGGAK